MHESPYTYERECRALTTGICVRAPRGGEGRSKLRRQGAEHACEVCAHSAVLRRRRARSMRDCRTRVRQSFRFWVLGTAESMQTAIKH
eukprot:6214777-Pleurochrysis_carterae.AAC.3